MNDWTEKYSSSGAKETLIKSVAQVIPTFAMSVFKFSATLCEELMHMTRDFWWGDDKDRRCIHRLSWEKLTKRKSQGGMGFKDLKVFNQALLARQAWRLIAHPDSLCARVLKAKYYHGADLLDTAFIHNASPGWQGIMHGLELLKKGCIWRICNGNSVRIWRDNWIPRGNMKINMNPTRSRTRWVADLIDQESHAWKEDYIMRIFTREDANDILSIRLPNYDDEDYIAWQPEKNGIFSVRSAYRLAMDEKGSGVIGSSHNTQGDRSIWNNIWKTNVPQKVRIFTWRLATE